MKKAVLITTLLLLFGLSGFSQTMNLTGTKKNGVYAEVYLVRHDFSEGFVSLNYERTVGKKQKTNLRAGIYPDFESSVAIPLTVSWVTRPQRNHHFEYGVGIMIRIEHYVDPYGINTREWFYDVPALMIPLMYRYENNAGLFLRGGINLFVSWPTLPSPSITVGYRF